MANMLDCRTDFHVSVIDGCLYAVAGRNNTGPLSTAEKYKVDKYEKFGMFFKTIYVYMNHLRFVQNVLAIMTLILIYQFLIHILSFEGPRFNKIWTNPRGVLEAENDMMKLKKYLSLKTKCF